MIYLAVAILLGLLSVAGVLAWSLRELDLSPLATPLPAPAPDGPRTPVLELAEYVGALGVRVADLEAQLRSLPGLYTEQADRAERAAERARKAAARDRAQRADLVDDGAADSPADAQGSGESSMPAVHQGMGGAEQEAYLAQIRRMVALAPLKGN
jgi:hypothetical protein